MAEKIIKDAVGSDAPTAPVPTTEAPVVTTTTTTLAPTTEAPAVIVTESVPVALTGNPPLPPHLDSRR